MLPPRPTRRRLQRSHDLEAATGLQHPLPTLRTRRCRRPRKARFRLAGWPLPGEGRTLRIATKGFRALSRHPPFQGLPCRKLGVMSAAAFATPLSAARAQAAPLPSWNDGPAKAAIVGFVERVTREGSADYVKPVERIATFDNDGTLWVEQPIYFQFAFAITRVKAQAAQNTLLQGSHGWRPGPDRGSRAALRLTRDARLALQAEPGPTPPHPGAEAQGHELARVRREPAPAWQLLFSDEAVEAWEAERRTSRG